MQIGRLEDAMFELQCLLNNDGPESKIHDVFNEVVSSPSYQVTYTFILLFKIIYTEPGN